MMSKRKIPFSSTAILYALLADEGDEPAKKRSYWADEMHLSRDREREGINAKLTNLLQIHELQ